ncbi:SDR family oxidoreductase [Dasania marina]|uniref:NAD-dependent epimerase/dehydratase family protein n=1 Tax=Dasania marina TaxID=471499 RepID=UPI0030D88938|tara:strand:- start:33623 stop:34489 length:867 start_codon:yes stop_codon:yes gene_type:complete
MNIGLLGSFGLIGSAIRVRLAGHTLRYLGRSQDECYLDLNKPIDATQLQGLDVLIHAAGVRDEDFNVDSVQAYNRSTVAIYELFSKAIESGVTKIVYISTAHVYGPMVGAINETTAVNPLSDYAIGHYASEQILQRLVRERGIEALIIRPNAVFGLGFDQKRFTRWQLVPFLFPKKAVCEGRIAVNSPAIKRNFISTDAIAGEIEQWLLAGSSGYKVLNPVASSMLSLGEFAGLCAEIAEKETGAPVALELGSSNQADDFNYSSIYPQPCRSEELKQFVSVFTQMLNS